MTDNPALYEALRDVNRPIHDGAVFVPACRLEDLGDASFRADHRLRFAYVAGAMANGIGSVEVVEAMSRAGMLGFFGAAGLPPARVEAAIERLSHSLGDAPHGFNLIHSPNEPDLENAVVNLYCAAASASSKRRPTSTSRRPSSATARTASTPTPPAAGRSPGVATWETFLAGVGRKGIAEPERRRPYFLARPPARIIRAARRRRTRPGSGVVTPELASSAGGKAPRELLEARRRAGYDGGLFSGTLPQRRRAVMEPRFKSLLQRLERLSAEVQELREGVRQSVMIAAQDPEMSLTRARKVLEYIVRDVYQNAYEEPAGTRPLESLLQRLVKDGHFPKRLSAYANGIRELGNVGTHGFGEGVTVQDVFQSLTQLTPIVEWYFQQRRPSPTAPPITQPAPDTAPTQAGGRRRGALGSSGPRQGRLRRWLMIAAVGAAVPVLLGVVVLLLWGTGWLFPAPTSPGKTEPARAVAPFDAAKAKRLQKAWADYLGVPVVREADLGGGVTMKLTLIPPGTFRMGSPEGEEGRDKDEGPQHEVEITRPFYLGVGPATRGQFAAFVEDDHYQTEAETDGQGGWGYNAATQKYEGRDPKYTWRNTGWAQTDAHPVVNVTWNDARAFCAWLSRKEGKTYELPTEAEWEYACRAGTTTRFWCGGDDASLQGAADIGDASLLVKRPAANTGIDDLDKALNKLSKTLDRLTEGAEPPASLEAVSWDDGYPFTSPVGTFKPNPWGLYDMHGNVWQWCADGYGPYQEGSVKDPKGDGSGDKLVERGGSWANSPGKCRSAYRVHSDPGDRSVNDGFRVVLRVPAGKQ